jgi:predicted dehydrogenase
MLAAARRHPKLVTQIVPSPFGLKGHDVVSELLEADYIGELREVQVVHFGAALADPAAALSWRQDATLSGFNALTLGILHETLARWVPSPVRVMAQCHAFIPSRIDPASGVRRAVGTPDSVQVLAVLDGGARAVYHLSGVTPLGQRMDIHLYGTAGVLHYDLLHDRLTGASRPRGQQELQEISISPEMAREWRVEAEFVDAIRHGTPIALTDFEAGVAYMEFTEAVARSAREGEAVELPLEEFIDGEEDYLLADS